MLSISNCTGPTSSRTSWLYQHHPVKPVMILSKNVILRSTVRPRIQWNVLSLPSFYMFLARMKLPPASPLCLLLFKILSLGMRTAEKLSLKPVKKANSSTCLFQCVLAPISVFYQVMYLFTLSSTLMDLNLHGRLCLSSLLTCWRFKNAPRSITDQYWSS